MRCDRGAKGTPVPRDTSPLLTTPPSLLTPYPHSHSPHKKGVRRSLD